MSSGTRIDIIIGVFFSVIFLVIGCIAVSIGRKVVRLAEESPRWPTATGTIVKSSIEQDRNNKYAHYRFEILFRFSVNGTYHTGNRLSYNGFDTSKNVYDASLVSRYPTGKSVAVYYCPEDPDECVLVPGGSAGTNFIEILGWVFLVVGVAMPVALLRNSQEIPLANLFNPLDVNVSYRYGPEVEFACPKCQNYVSMEVLETTTRQVLISRFVLHQSKKTTATCGHCGADHDFIMSLEEFTNNPPWELTRYGESEVTGPMKFLVVLGFLCIPVPIAGLVLGIYGTSQLYDKKTRWRYASYVTLGLAGFSTAPVIKAMIYYLWG